MGNESSATYEIEANVPDAIDSKLEDSDEIAGIVPQLGTEASNGDNDAKNRQ